MLLMFVVFSFVLVVDQVAKTMIATRLDEGAFTSANICGIRLRHVVNRRRPWGSTTAVRIMAVVWLLLSAAALVAGALIDSPSTFIALGALMGGAMGNLVDGISKNGVTDFIDLRVWPVFNVADTAIVGGALLLVWNVVRLRTGA
jgi:signal peptidase II